MKIGLRSQSWAERVLLLPQGGDKRILPMDLAKEGWYFLLQGRVGSHGLCPQIHRRGVKPLLDIAGWE